MTNLKNFQNENSSKIENRKLKILFLGTPFYLDPIIQVLKDNFNLIKVFRSPKESLEEITNLSPDLLIVASFGKIIPQEILKVPKLGAINIHPSRLPKYRGPSPLQSQILDGVSDSAISYILMDSEMDHGPILLQKDLPILETDTFESLCQKAFLESSKYLPEVIDGLADGSITPKEQNHTEATFTNLVKKEDGYFDIENPPSSEKLERMARAFYPWPGAWTKWKEKIVKFLPSSVIPAKAGIYKNKILIQMEGKSATDFKSFLNGYPDFPLLKP